MRFALDFHCVTHSNGNGDTSYRNRTLKRLIQIENEFSPAKFFPSQHISSVFLAPFGDSEPFQGQMIQKIADLAGGLKCLTFYGANITDAYLLNLPSRLTALQEVSFKQCSNITHLLSALISIPSTVHNLTFSNMNQRDTDVVRLDFCLNSEFMCLNRFNMLNKLSFTNCPRITGFVLSYLFSFLDPIKKYPTMQTLDFHGSGVIDTNLNFLKYFSNLSTLILSQSQITGAGLEYIGHCTALQTLELAGLPIEDGDLSWLEDLPTVRTLDLSGCPITNVALDCFQSWTHLQTLKLANCQQFTGRGLSFLKNCTALQSLDLTYCPIQDAFLAHLSGSATLHTLNLFGCPVDGSGLKHLENCTALSTLTLSSCQIKETNLHYLSKYNSLRTLNLNDCKITDLGLQFLTGCHSLEILNLSNCLITDASLNLLQRSFKRLQSLMLGRCQNISENGLNHLIKHPSFKELIISDYNLTRDIRTQLEKRFCVIDC